MFDNQIVQKSREVSTRQQGVNRSEEGTAKIYFDQQQAILDFESEAQLNQEIPAQDSRISPYLENAQILMKHREYSLAMNLLRQASNLDSKNPTTLQLLAACLEKRGNNKEALIARKVLTQIHYGFDSLYRYATALYKEGSDQDALEKYFEALAVLKEENVHLFEIYKNMGNIFVRQGDYDGAEEYYNKAYTLDSESDVLLVNFGTLEVQRNDFEKALYCFRRAVEINSQNDKAWVGLAMVHNQLGDSDLAWANIETAIDINPKNRTAVHLAANWGMRDRKMQKAIEALQNYLANVEEDEDMSLVLINMFCSIGQIEQALLEIERVLLFNPDHGEVRKLKKQILKNQQVA